MFSKKIILRFEYPELIILCVVDKSIDVKVIMQAGLSFLKKYEQHLPQNTGKRRGNFRICPGAGDSYQRFNST